MVTTLGECGWGFISFIAVDIEKLSNKNRIRIIFGHIHTSTQIHIHTLSALGKSHKSNLLCSLSLFLFIFRNSYKWVYVMCIIIKFYLFVFLLLLLLLWLWHEIELDYKKFRRVFKLIWDIANWSQMKINVNFFFKLTKV